MGLLTTAGRLLFSGDGAGNFVAFDPANGKPLWHSRLGDVAAAVRGIQADAAGTIVLSNGSAIAVPNAPRKNVRRSKCFFVMNMGYSLVCAIAVPAPAAGPLVRIWNG